MTSLKLLVVSLGEAADGSLGLWCSSAVLWTRRIPLCPTPLAPTILSALALIVLALFSDDFWEGPIPHRRSAEFVLFSTFAFFFPA